MSEPFRKINPNPHPRHRRNHYDFLDEHYGLICQRLGVEDHYRGSWTSNGDKFRQYDRQGEAAGIPFFHLAAMYMLLDSVYHREVRETPQGWVAPIDWILANYRDGHNLSRVMEDLQ